MPKTTPFDDTVTLESSKTFSAWPILFGDKRRDRGGLWFNAESVLQPPFDAYKVLFQFTAPDPDNPQQNKLYNLVAAEVVRWKINPLGLWIRARFYESPAPDDENHPHTRLLDGLRAEMRKGAVAMSHSSLQQFKSGIREDGYVSVYPIQLFNLYEKALFDEQKA